MLSFILADSALELVPKEIWGSPAVAGDAKRRGVEPSKMLLDRSFHHSAMARLRDSEKRGRPDLVHAALLSVTGAPLYLGGGARVWVHTPRGVVVEIAGKTRIPKHYIRFRGLMEQALAGEGTGGLVMARRLTFRELIATLRPGRVFGLSVRGERRDLSEVARRATEVGDPAMVVGGFPHGHFSTDVAEQLDELARIDEKPLEAHVVAARVVYEIEKAEAGSMIKRSRQGSGLVRSSSSSH